LFYPLAVDLRFLAAPEKRKDADNDSLKKNEGGFRRSWGLFAMLCSAFPARRL